MRRLLSFASVALLVALLTPSHVDAQSIRDRLRAKAQQRADARVDRGLDRVIDGFDGAIGCVVGDAACQQRARAGGKKVVLTDSTGAVLPPDQQPEDSPARHPREDAATTAPAPAPAAAAARPSRPGEGVWTNFDFVPGARVMFAEDFSNDRVGNFPQRLELVNGNLDVIEWQGGRWLRMMSDGAISIPLPEILPSRFTMEFTIAIPWNGLAIYSAAEADQQGPAANDRASAAVVLSGTQAGVYRAHSGTGSLVDPRPLFADMFADDRMAVSRPFKVRVEVDGRYMKVYLDEKRVANIPNADFGRANKVNIEFSAPFDEDHAGMISDISINAGGQGLYDALMADGHVATQGILFDVGSDRLRGESTPTLKQIGDMLAAHPELRLAVEGHTDNTGTAAGNLSLSTRRAQSIVTYLTTTLHVAPARLTSRGLGQTRPVAPNTTPEGRQANRRVELVKQ